MSEELDSLRSNWYLQGIGEYPVNLEQAAQVVFLPMGD